MIPVTRPDGSTLLINPDRIETIEDTPDCIITFADGKKLLVRESSADVASRFMAYQKAIRMPNSRFGGRRVGDPPANMDPSLYTHPGRAQASGMRIGRREDDDA